MKTKKAKFKIKELKKFLIKRIPQCFASGLRFSLFRHSRLSGILLKDSGQARMTDLKPLSLLRGSSILNSRREGFSLIEIVMIIVIVSIAIPALLILIGGEAGRGVDPELRVTAANVAQQLMDEIRTKCWDETATTGANCSGTVSYSTLGIDGGETINDTSTYDDVDDYTAGVPPVQIPAAGGISYSRSVSVCYVPNTGLNDTSTCNTGTDYKRIAVTVSRGNTSVSLTTVITNY